jgi:hypothetical protein
MEGSEHIFMFHCGHVRIFQHAVNVLLKFVSVVNNALTGERLLHGAIRE